MTKTASELVAAAKSLLLERNVTHRGQPWEGPIAQALIIGLRISWGSYNPHYAPSEDVERGNNTAIPTRSMPMLIELSTRHFEAFHLLRQICVDLLSGPNELSHDLRIMCSGYVQGTIPEPKKSVAAKKMPSHKLWFRDTAILNTLTMLKECEGILPTKNRGSSPHKLSGATIVQEALLEIWNERENLPFECPFERTIEEIWVNRNKITEVFKNAEKELSALTGNNMTTN